jgi:hypothetical protein
MNEYFLALSKNAPFVTLAVLGMGTLYGKMGLAGKAQLAAAFLTGLLVGGGFQIASVGLPVDFSGWFYVALSAILMGLMPSGVYEAVKAARKE